MPSPQVRVRVAGFRQGRRESPRASARSERVIRSSPGFLCDPRTSLPVSDTIYVVAEDDEKAEEEVMKLGGGG